MIALTSTGPMSGKSTLAKHLEHHMHFLRADHSQTLLEEFVWNENALNGLEVMPFLEMHPLTVQQVLANKEAYRIQLQRFGYTVGFNDPVRSGTWTDRTLAGWYQDPWRDVVYEPVRGDDQAAALRKRGFLIVQLEIPEVLREARAHLRGRDYHRMVLAMHEHPELECGVTKPDVRIDGTQPLDRMVQDILVVSDQRKKEQHGRG
jgi:hypothetical protein